MLPITTAVTTGWHYAAPDAALAAAPNAGTDGMGANVSAVNTTIAALLNNPNIPPDKKVALEEASKRIMSSTTPAALATAIASAASACAEAQSSITKQEILASNTATHAQLVAADLSHMHDWFNSVTSEAFLADHLLYDRVRNPTGIYDPTTHHIRNELVYDPTRPNDVENQEREYVRTRRDDGVVVIMNRRTNQPVPETYEAASAQIHDLSANGARDINSQDVAGAYNTQLDTTMRLATMNVVVPVPNMPDSMQQDLAAAQRFEASWPTTSDGKTARQRLEYIRDHYSQGTYFHDVDGPTAARYLAALDGDQRRTETTMVVTRVQLDINGDGIVNRDDIKMLAEKIDKDHSGNISTDEMATFMRVNNIDQIAAAMRSAGISLDNNNPNSAEYVLGALNSQLHQQAAAAPSHTSAAL